MIEASVAMVALAGLFVAFGLLRVADRTACGGGCHGCTGGSECNLPEAGARGAARAPEQDSEESGGIP